MKVLVIGDSCNDIHIYGNCERICPDAPVPVFVPKTQKKNRGMAGNVYENLISLGIDAFLVTNRDEVTKTRYVEERTNHMIVRVDSGEEKISRIDNLQLVPFEEYDAVVVSDYNKGFLTEEDIQYIAENHDITFLDTKKLIGPWVRDIKFIKINETEHNRTKHLLKDCDWIVDKMIITIGSKGCSYLEKIYPVERVEIKDTSGAGDTFIAALVSKYIEEGDIDMSIEFANMCATKIVQQKGVNVI